MNFSSKRFAEVFAALIPLGALSPLGGNERRRAPRVELRFQTRLLLAGRGPDRMIDVELHDLSIRGMKFVHDGRIDQGQQFVFAVPQLNGGPLPLLCTVVHASEAGHDRFTIGAEFTCPLPRETRAIKAPDTVTA